MSSLLSTIQDETLARLQGIAYFAGNGSDIPSIPVFSERIADIESQIEIAVGQIGVCCIILTPFAGEALSDASKPYFQKITVVVRVVEAPTLNTTRPRAAEIAEAVSWWLHQFRPVQSASCMTVKQILLTDMGEGYIAYDVTLEMPDGRANEPQREKIQR